MGGLNGWGAYPYYLDYPTRTVHDRFRVEFKDNRVITVEQETSAGQNISGARRSLRPAGFSVGA